MVSIIVLSVDECGHGIFGDGGLAGRNGVLRYLAQLVGLKMSVGISRSQAFWILDDAFAQVVFALGHRSANGAFRASFPKVPESANRRTRIDATEGILGPGDRFKVGGLATKGIRAVRADVIDGESFGDWTRCQRIGDAVCVVADPLTIIDAVWSAGLAAGELH